MEEAERFCHRVGIIDYGKIIAMETPHALIAKQNLDSAVEFTASDKIDKQLLEDIPGVSELAKEEDKFILYTKDSHKVLMELIRISDRHKFNLKNISVRKATLEDVFLELTGRKLREWTRGKKKDTRSKIQEARNKSTENKEQEAREESDKKLQRLGSLQTLL